MKKLIHTSIIAITLASAAANASESIEKDVISEPSYACRVMLERGSEMFCQKEKVLAYFEEETQTLAAMEDEEKAARPVPSQM